jgi:hypothetical protein
MHHNARPLGYLRDTETPVMEWPARSPDLNSIEHM